MKPSKQLQEIFNKAKGEHPYYSFEDFKSNARDFVKDCRERTTFCAIKASKSGMSRKFNFHKYNMLLNIVFNEKFSWDPVYVGGCGMDMHWYLKYSVCKELCTKEELNKHNLNSACSSGVIL